MLRSFFKPCIPFPVVVSTTPESPMDDSSILTISSSVKFRFACSSAVNTSSSVNSLSSSISKFSTASSNSAPSRYFLNASPPLAYISLILNLFLGGCPPYTNVSSPILPSVFFARLFLPA